MLQLITKATWFPLAFVPLLAVPFSARSSCLLACSLSCSFAALLFRNPSLVELFHYPFQATLVLSFHYVVFEVPLWMIHNLDCSTCIAHIWFYSQRSQAPVCQNMLHVLLSNRRCMHANHSPLLFWEWPTLTICKQPPSCLRFPCHCQLLDRIRLFTR